MLRTLTNELKKIRKTLQSIDNKLESQNITVTNTVNSSEQLTEREVARQSKINLRKIAKQYDY